MSYKLTTDGGVRRLADGAWIPRNAANLDWQAYKAWEKANIPEPADEDPKPEKRLTVDSLADALKAAGRLTQEQIDAAKK